MERKIEGREKEEISKKHRICSIHIYTEISVLRRWEEERKKESGIIGKKRERRRGLEGLKV
jgi:hypothetical protein